MIVAVGLIFGVSSIRTENEEVSSIPTPGVTANQFFDWCFVEGSIEKGLVPAFELAERTMAEAGFNKEIAAYTRRCVVVTYEVTFEDWGAAFGGTYIKVNPALKGNVKEEAFALVHEITHAWDYYKEKGHWDCVNHEASAFFAEYRAGLWSKWNWVGTTFEAQLASRRLAENHCSIKH